MRVFIIIIILLGIIIIMMPPASSQLEPTYTFHNVERVIAHEFDVLLINSTTRLYSDMMDGITGYSYSYIDAWMDDTHVLYTGGKVYVDGVYKYDAEWVFVSPIAISAKEVGANIVHIIVIGKLDVAIGLQVDVGTYNIKELRNDIITDKIIIIRNRTMDFGWIRVYSSNGVRYYNRYIPWMGENTTTSNTNVYGFKDYTGGYGEWRFTIISIDGSETRAIEIEGDNIVYEVYAVGGELQSLSPDMSPANSISAPPNNIIDYPGYISGIFGYGWSIWSNIANVFTISINYIILPVKIFTILLGVSIVIMSIISIIYFATGDVEKIFYMWSTYIHFIIIIFRFIYTMIMWFINILISLIRTITGIIRG